MPAPCRREARMKFLSGGTRKQVATPPSREAIKGRWRGRTPHGWRSRPDSGTCRGRFAPPGRMTLDKIAVIGSDGRSHGFPLGAYQEFRTCQLASRAFTLTPIQGGSLGSENIKGGSAERGPAGTPAANCRQNADISRTERPQPVGAPPSARTSGAEQSRPGPLRSYARHTRRLPIRPNIQAREAGVGWSAVGWADTDKWLRSMPHPLGYLEN